MLFAPEKFPEESVSLGIEGVPLVIEGLGR